MEISIKKEVFQKFHPKLKIIFLLVEELDNKSKLHESEHILQEMERLTHLTFHKDNPKTHNLISPWTAAQLEFGSEAKHYKTSLEKLLHTVLNHKSTKAKDTLTNLLHYLALKHLVPFGADDLKKIKGNITFALAEGKEKADFFHHLKEKALYYRDDKVVLGTKLDYWKNSKTKVSPKTKNALVHFEILPPVTPEHTKKLIDDAKTLISGFYSGKVKVFILNAKKSSIKI